MTPAEQFLKFRKEHVDTLRAESQRDWFLTALTYSLAELADRGATFDELNGATRFSEILCKLAADEVKLSKLPIKSLKVLDKGGATAEAEKEK